MAQYKIKDPKAIACIILAAISLPAIIVLFTMGGVFFSEEHPKELNYANSMCQVNSRSYKFYQCKARYYTYTCYGPVWQVHHGENRDVLATVEEEKRYRSSSDALNKAYEYQINSSYSCWYDLRNPSIAQWDQPSTRIAIILLCCGGLSVLLFVLAIFLTVQLVKQEMLQNQQDNMVAYSNPNSYKTIEKNINQV